VKSIPRRTPREFAFVVKQSGRTHLLLVEGFSDRAFFRWALSLEEAARLAIHAIGELEVSAHWLSEDLTFGSNRSLVVAACIAHETERVFGSLSVRGVIDRDCGVPEAWNTVSSVDVTDVPALESLCFTADTLQKWLHLFVHDDEISGEELLRELVPILGGLFSVRENFGSLGGEVSRILSYSNGTWRWRFSHAPSYAAIFEEGASTALSQADPRAICYGHDLAAVLMIRFANRVKNSAGIRSLEGLERSLIGALEREAVRGEPLLVRLVGWVTGRP
jgi:hypothetical protein